MELTDYRRELVAKVQEKAVDEGLFDQEAFFQVACEMLRDSEAIADYQPIEPGYRFGEGTSRFMAVDGYDQSAFEMDESIVVIACDDYSKRVGDEQIATIQAKDCTRYIKAMRRYVQASLNGSFLEQAEESSAAWEFASFIHEHKQGISRVRLYFVTDREYTGRDSSIKNPTDFYSKNETGRKISLEAHVWDLRHLMEASQAAAPLEHLTVNLGDEGIPAVKAPEASNGMNTYLMFLSGQTLSTWYKKHGSKLMEANVRSFLSLRGKVNRGIRNTLDTEPDRFVAYNNGLSATASMVDINEHGNITAIHDLQIVNGGQTTASIFYSQKKDKLDLSRVVVPVKLVVVQEDIARELVPYISRYTNSQNKVAETDFSSNSEYQVKLSQLSQQVLTPPLPGKNPTHWYYERTRGQYDSEKNRRDTADRKRFEKLNPSKQRIKMIDAPKYLMCWDGYPHIASLGSQKCFARFVESESKKGQSSIQALDTEFFKRLVCKRIIFDTIYRHIKTADWYKGAYQGNIAEYAVAKYALDLSRFHVNCDFETIWRTQRINDTTLRCLLKAAEQASDVLNDSDRPTQNVSEWAKKEACWDVLRRRPSCLGAQLPPMSLTPNNTIPVAHDTSLVAKQLPKFGDTAPAFAHSSSERAQSVPKHKSPEQMPDTRIDDWSTVPSKFLRELYAFAREHNILSPKAEVSLKTLINDESGDINANALNYLLARSVNSGFQYADLSTEMEEEPRITSPSSQSRPKSIRKPSENIEHDVNYQRDFLMAIPDNTWYTIIAWAKSRYALNDEVLAGIAKISKHTRLTDEQTRHLWAWRQKLIRKGLSASQFAPRPGSY